MLTKLNDRVFINVKKVSFIETEKRIYAGAATTQVRIVVEGAIIYLSEVELPILLDALEKAGML